MTNSDIDEAGNILIAAEELNPSARYVIEVDAEGLDGAVTKSFVYVSTDPAISIEINYDSNIQYTLAGGATGHCTRGINDEGTFRARGWSVGLFEGTATERNVFLPEGSYNEIIVCYSQDDDITIARRAQLTQAAHDDDELSDWIA